uniref:Uncharacterized protein n=1 Tax=Aegilops tauschii subsp. strangulata TaxID=200361 RepID=A0A453NYS6_AEGTS
MNQQCRCRGCTWSKADAKHFISIYSIPSNTWRAPATSLVAHVVGHDARRDGELGWEVAEGLDGAGGLAGVVVGGEEGGEGAVGGGHDEAEGGEGVCGHVGGGVERDEADEEALGGVRRREGGEGGGEHGADEVGAGGGGEAGDGEEEDRAVAEEGRVRDAFQEEGGELVGRRGGTADGVLDADELGGADGGVRGGLGLRGEEAHKGLAAEEQRRCKGEGLAERGGGGHRGRASRSPSHRGHGW